MKLTAALFAGALCAVAAPTWAASDAERAGARAAAIEAVNAYNAHDYGKSLDLFKRAESLVHSPVHVLYMARCEVQLGMLVEAQEAYTRISRERFEADAPPAFARSQADAATELEQLKPRIPMVTLVVQGAGPDGLSITVDGVPFPPALVGLPAPMNPGAHKLKAKAPGFASDLTDATVAEGTPQTVTLVMKPSAEPPPTPAEEAKPAAAATGTPAADQGPSPSGGPSGLRIGSYAAMGVGALGLIGGTVFAIVAAGDRSKANDLCNGPGGSCPESKRGQIDDADSGAKSMGTLSVVAFSVGVVGAGAGVALFLMSGEKHSAESARGPSVTPWVGLGSAGLNGRF
ncbi:MAG TPA: hypothetical protein VHE30_05990 [Polyangiaceae bacterium]|nr:hypothetical protein [Polyangiaceae bacterium]